ncbi:MAG: hypothetical protein ACE5GV_17195 [Candidatus Scalindua sp.]
MAYSSGRYSKGNLTHTRSLGLKYYCLGYYVSECRRMAYNNNFKPRG